MPHSAKLYALSESYVYTTEALMEYINYLHSNGLLAITRGVKLPPRDGLKLFATAVAALEKMGVKEPGRRLVLIPWAWGINGCASVISAILATLWATHFGFSFVVIFAVCLYILAAVICPQRI